MPSAPASASVPATHAYAHWIDGERFITGGSSGHAVVLDASREHNSAPGPMEMVLRSLCGCTATDMVIVLQKKRQAFTAIEVSAEGERAPEPPQVYTRIRMHYRVRGRDLDPAAVERAAELSHQKYCSVLQMLHKTAAISYDLAIEAEAAAVVGA